MCSTPDMQACPGDGRFNSFGGRLDSGDKDRERESMKDATDATDATASQALQDILRHYKTHRSVKGKEILLSHTLDSLTYDGLNYPTIFAMAEQLSPGLTVSGWEELMQELELWEAQRAREESQSQDETKT